MSSYDDRARLGLRESATFDRPTIAAIQRASENLDMSVLVEVATRIANSGNVLCIGSGGISSMMATEMQNRLFRLGLSALGQTDGQLQRMYAAVATPETTLLAFSVSGYARSVIEAVEVAQQYGAATVAITAPDSALAKVADTVIFLQPVEDGSRGQLDGLERRHRR